LVEQSATVQLLRKLKAVYDGIPFVEKRGHNQHHRYAFVQNVDVVRDVRAHLLKQGVIVVPATVPGSVRHLTETGGKSFVTTVDLIYRFIDTETGAEIQVPWTGAGADTGGDKGIYKAYTGGLKYALISLFLLPMTEDPEHDGLTEQPDPGKQRDAERPAAPTIPRDRATLILNAAIDAGLASAEQTEADGPVAYTFTPILKAKLADLGVEKIGALNVDQAEELEAFIAAEAAQGPGNAA